MSSATPKVITGLDVSDRYSSYYTITAEGGEVAEEGRVRTTPGALEAHFGGPRRRIVTRLMPRRWRGWGGWTRSCSIRSNIEARKLSRQIRFFDKQIEALCEERYPEPGVLRQIKGVGPVTALTFCLVIEDPARFPRSRTVGAYLGLTRRHDDSGESEPELRITKAGDEFLRRLLVQSAHYILGRFGPVTDLRRWGLRYIERGGGSKTAKKKAAVAVARKLAVLLHRLWRKTMPQSRNTPEPDTMADVILHGGGLRRHAVFVPRAPIRLRPPAWASRPC